MVLAMMEWAAAIVATRPRRSRPSARAALLERLVALNQVGQPFRLEPAPRADLEIRFDPVDPAWAARFSRVKLSTRYRARLVLDEVRHQIRWFEMVSGSSCFIGFDGLRPRLSWSLWFVAGYVDVIWSGYAYGIRPGLVPRVADAVPFRLDTVALKRRIRAIAGRAGWAFRPKLWWFQVRRRADGTVPQGLIPSETRFWTERQFWGMAYVLLYVASLTGIGVGSAGWAGFSTRATLLPLLGFSVFWWAVSGGILLIFWLVSRPSRSERKPGPARGEDGPDPAPDPAP